MAFLSLFELLDIVITIVAAGFIFMDLLRRPGSEATPFGERLLFSASVAAPAIVLHEFGHKFVALALGYSATFHAAYTWLGIGVLLKLIGFPFLIIVPAYVSIIGPAGVPAAFVALAGPLVNCLLWLGATVALKSGKQWSRTTEAILYYTKTINLILFLFNLLPIPGFDGYNALRVFF